MTLRLLSACPSALCTQPVANTASPSCRLPVRLPPTRTEARLCPCVTWCLASENSLRAQNHKAAASPPAGRGCTGLSADA